MILLILAALIWLACGITAAYLAHTGLQHDYAEETGSSGHALGGLWVIWGPFLTGLVALGAFALLCICIIEKDRLWPAPPPMDLTEGLEDES